MTKLLTKEQRDRIFTKVLNSNTENDNKDTPVFPIVPVCVYCLEEAAVMVNLPCGHLICCENCHVVDSLYMSNKLQDMIEESPNPNWKDIKKRFLDMNVCGKCNEKFKERRLVYF